MVQRTLQFFVVQCHSVVQDFIVQCGKRKSEKMNATHTVSYLARQIEGDLEWMVEFWKAKIDGVEKAFQGS